MDWYWWLLAFILVAPFTLVILRGAPFLPTKDKYTHAALDMMKLKRGQTILDLGCGDGKVLQAAGERGLKGVGFEINPFLWLIAKYRTRKFKDIQIYLTDMWKKPIPEGIDGIYVFLIDHFMEKLDKKIEKERNGKPIKLVSFAFPIPGKKPKASKDNLRLYTYS